MLRRPSTRSITARWYCPGERSGGRLAAAIQQADDEQAATVGVLSRAVFTLGLGAAENLNEHITGAGWPAARVRHERLEEAVEIIRQLFAGEYVSYQGRHFQVERAKLYDLPDQAPPVG